MGALYDQIGRSYRTTRVADPRIVAKLMRSLDLPPGAVVCDLGAGSGNYSNAIAERGLCVLAVEPSQTMRSQAQAHPRVTWLSGVAEAIPLGTGVANGAVCTLACHHFSDINQAFGEIARVCPDGPVVIFTMDPRLRAPNWIDTYFPQVREIDFEAFLPVDELLHAGRNAFRREGTIEPFPLPPDLADNFLFAPWNRPEIYLDDIFRANTSGFARGNPEVIAGQVEALARDLQTGRWDDQYSFLRRAAAFDAGFYFASFSPTSPTGQITGKR